jgi:hypothetical protein
LIRVQLRQSINRFFGEFGGRRRTFIFESIDGTVVGVLDPPSAAQINHSQAVRDSFRNQRTRRLMRRT